MTQYAYQVEKDEDGGIVAYREGMNEKYFEVAPPQFAKGLMDQHCPNGYTSKERREVKPVHAGLVSADAPWLTVTYKCKK